VKVFDMGFSSSLQGAASSEALLSRQDAEIRLLEAMRRCLVQRVKADREYAVALSAFVAQAGGAKVKHMHPLSSFNKYTYVLAKFFIFSRKVYNRNLIVQYFSVFLK